MTEKKLQKKFVKSKCQSRTFSCFSLYSTAQLSHSSCIRSVLLDHKLEVDGIIFHEHKELETTINVEGNKEVVFSHTRAIGDRVYKAQQRVIDGEVREETCETQMAPEEIEDFKNEWDEKWQPSIVEQSTDIRSWMMRNLTTF